MTICFDHARLPDQGERHGAEHGQRQQRRMPVEGFDDEAADDGRKHGDDAQPDAAGDAPK